MIEEYLNSETFTTRKELVAITGMCDRLVRDKISNLKLEKPVIYNSQTRGYRLAKDLSKLSREEVIIEMLEVKHSKADIQSRIDVFQEQLKVYDEYLKNGEVILMRKTNEELYDRGSVRNAKSEDRIISRPF